MHRDPVAPRTVVARPPERVRADEDATLRPPERDLVPPPPLAHVDELELSNLVPRDDVMRDAKADGEASAVTVVAMDELNDTCRLAGGAHPLLDPLDDNGIDQPDASVRDERVGAPLEELVADPAEAA